MMIGTSFISVRKFVLKVWVHFKKLFSRVKSTSEEKMEFIKGNELKLTQTELLSSFIFKSV